MLDESSRRALLEELRGMGSDADASSDPVKVFLPLLTHQKALSPQILIIRGERGAGKTALFRFLGELSKRSIPFSTVFPNTNEADWLDGFSERQKYHPLLEVVEQWGSSVEEESLLRAFWFGHLVGCLSRISAASPLPEPFGQSWKRGKPEEWVPLARTQLSELAQWLDQLDEDRHGRLIFVSYDHLDKLGLKQLKLRSRFTAALSSMWLSLSNRLSSIKGKIFLREDLFRSSQLGTTDASKLETRSVSLYWSSEDLYRLLLRQLGTSERLRQWLEKDQSVFSTNAILCYMPPLAMPEEAGTFTQKMLVERLAGVQMGEGVNKAYTYRWIPNHLQDALGAVVPRSLLNLIAFASEIALLRGSRAGYTRLLHYTELAAALDKTSRYRVAELKEEYPVVERLESLRGISLLAEKEHLIQKLSEPKDDGFSKDGKAVFEELHRIGVFKIRGDGRVDIPDIYRHHFDIKRKGGIAR
jgi:hypothetical protein